MGTCFFALAVVCFIIGVVQLILPASEKSTPSIPFRQPRPVIPPRRQYTPAPPTTFRESPQPESPNTGGANMIPQKLTWVRVGERIRVKHPSQGEYTLYVMGKVLYQELWQRTRGPQSPWVPTGNVFPGFWLENNLFLLNWLNRFYLLEERIPLTDNDIQRDFAPHARQYAQSNQTADVYFAYPPASWHIDDIGKFRVLEIEGEAPMFQTGTTGRFIHNSGSEGRALVVEDYEGGGGQDSAWIGVLIQEADIQQT